MRLMKIWYAIALILALLPELLGCTPRLVHEAPPKGPAEAAQHAINEAQVAIASGYMAITDAKASGLITVDEFTYLRDDVLDNADRTYRDALTLLQASDFIKAKSRAEIALSLTKVAETQIAAARRKK